MGVEAVELPETLAALAEALKERRLSPVEVARALLECIEERDGESNAFITVLAEEALDAAARAETQLLAGEYKGPLHGVPLGLKDLIYTKGIRTTMGSAFFEDFLPEHDATVARRLGEAGAVVVGKMNTHEFAYGPTGDRSYFGPVRNPHDSSRISGGSSSGSAAAVATRLLYGALGSDTGGSIRIPSALCGTVGMKPTFGRVSKHGIFPLSWALDHAGPITRTVEDNALLLNALAGHDPRDPYSVSRPAEDFTRDLERGVRGGKVGIPAGFYFEHVEGKVEEKVREAIEVFRKLGVEVREVALPGLWETLQAQRLVLAADAYAVHEQRLEEEPEKFGEEVRERLLGGEGLKAHRYATALQTRLRSLEDFGRVFEEVDVLLTPTVPIAATEIGQRDIAIGGYEEQVPSALTRLTGPTNLNGLPSLSVPCGLVSPGLPVGLQIIGRPLDEATVYRYGRSYEETNSPKPGEVSR